MTRCGRRIVVLGMMSKMPVGGVVWQTLHYLVGLERLGYEVYYVEAHARTPSMFMDRPENDGSRHAAALIDRVLGRVGLGDRWAFQALHADGACFGMSEHRIGDLYDSAALIINLHGGTMPRPEHAATGRLVYLETDPVQVQAEIAEQRPEALEFLDAHVAWFTFGESYGTPACGLATSERYPFQPTRQPVVLDFWKDGQRPSPSIFATVGNWRQHWRQVSVGGEVYHWSKDLEWERFLELPRLTGQAFELALSSYTPADEELLHAAGWHVVAALPFTRDADRYREYILGSRGEFTVAKDQNVRLRSGWFSDRSATYLAAGRPVVTQDTGFGEHLPTGEGLFAVSDVEEAAEAVERVNADYERHARAAEEIAREHFDSDRVLRDLLDRAGV